MHLKTNDGFAPEVSSAVALRLNSHRPTGSPEYRDNDMENELSPRYILHVGETRDNANAAPSPVTGSQVWQTKG